MEIVGIVLLIVIISDSKSPGTLVGFMLVTSEIALLFISFYQTSRSRKLPIINIIGNSSTYVRKLSQEKYYTIFKVDSLSLSKAKVF